jgi:hypothetical protein
LTSGPNFRLALLTAGLLLPSLLPLKAHAADWQAPTPQELSMTSEPAAPGAAAIYLFREEICDDKLHMHSMYVRLKVLTDEGKKYADVEIPYESRRFSIADVSGRTIHADGTIIPFTGKPYDKMLEKSATYRVQAKVFSMPDVQVGSILEYRYQLRYEDTYAVPPTWYIQNALYLRKAHYRFIVTQDNLIDMKTGHPADTIIWLPILPKGVTVKHVEPPAIGPMGKSPHYYELNIENVPPEPDEEYLPPVRSLTYRVYFVYSEYSNEAEFWKSEGKSWSKQADKFMNADQALSAMVNQLTLPPDSQDQKLQKLYAGVMAFENTDFTRERSAQEEKSEGLRQIKTVQDIIQRKRGSSDELTLLFVALARAAGMKAYVMAVTNRDSDVFNRGLMSMGQLDDDIAIVNLNGKEQFFDPGERYCAYGQLHWKHTIASGIRQIDNGTDFATAPQEPYSDSKTIRIANLTMSEDGRVSGTVKVGYTGVPALSWRQRALRSDEAEVGHDMEREMREQLPGGLTVKLDAVKNLDDYSKQLVVSFNVEGPLATASSKRLFVPVEIFEANAKPMFTQPKRVMPIYFHYAHQIVDQVSITLPASLSIESMPAKEQVPMQKLAMLVEGANVKGNTLTLSRDFALGSIIFKPEEYDDLHSFYAKVNHKDQEQAILKVTGHEAGD